MKESTACFKYIIKKHTSNKKTKQKLLSEISGKKTCSVLYILNDYIYRKNILRDH